MTERKTRKHIIFQLESRSVEEVKRAIEQLKIEYGEKFKEVFKSITSDNRTEFAKVLVSVG